MNRTWLGTTIIGVVGTVTSLAGIARDWPQPLVVALVILTAVAVLLTWPKAPEPPRPDQTTAFVRGDASRSRFTRVEARNADAFVDGNARDAVFTDILFTTGRNAKSRVGRIRHLIRRLPR